MSKKSIISIAIVAVLAVLAIWGIGKYNGLVAIDEETNRAWANVETAYQSRADLIPNLVETVKAYAKHESETFQAVVEARAKATSINLSVDSLTEENIEQYRKMQDDLYNEMKSYLPRLIAISESYPELKANENFLKLQDQLEGQENRVRVERINYNEAVQKYNTEVRRFPTNIVAMITGFGRRAEFKAEAGAEKAPKVQF